MDNTITGQLSFDYEYYGAKAGIGTIVVSAGIRTEYQLTLRNVTLNGGALDIYGTLDTDASVLTTPDSFPIFNLYANRQFSNLSGIRFNFQDGSGGSSLSDCNKMKMTINSGPQTFSNVNQSELYLNSAVNLQTITATNCDWTILDGTMIGTSRLILGGSNALLSNFVLKDSARLECLQKSFMKNGITLQNSASLLQDNSRMEDGTINLADQTYWTALGKSAVKNCTINVGGAAELNFSDCSFTVASITPVIKLESNSTSSFTKCGFTYHEFQVSQSASLAFSQSVLNNVAINSTGLGEFSMKNKSDLKGSIHWPSGKAVIENSRIVQGGISIGDDRSVISGCRLWMVNLYPCSARITDNIFRYALTFMEGTWDGKTPTIANNCFCGRQAIIWNGSIIPTSRVPIGKNYYSDVEGPAFSEGGFLNAGSYVTPERFLLDGFNTRGEGWHEPDYAPEFCSRGIVLGQICFDGSSIPTIYQDEDTLVVADIFCSDKEVYGTDFWLEFDGEKFYSDPPLNPIRRDLAGYSRTATNTQRKYSLISSGITTLNFIIKPKKYGQAKDFELKLMADFSRLSNYTAQGTQQLLEYLPRVRTAPRLPGQIKIAVIPIFVDIWQYNDAIPDPVANAEEIRKHLRAMTSLPEECFDIRPIPKIIRVSSSFPIGFGMSVYYKALSEVNKWMAEQYTNEGVPGLYDFTFAPMAKGNMLFGVEGASSSLNRSAIIWDESIPIALTHELGHAVGLWTDKEQYDVFSPLGLLVEEAIMFNQYNVNEFNYFAEAGRVHNKRVLLQPKPVNEIYDIMGSPQKLWPDPDTAYRMNQSLHNRLHENRRAAWEKDKSTLISNSPPEPGKKRLLITADLENLHPELNPEITEWKVIEGTVRIVDVTLSSQVIIPTLAPYEQNNYSISYVYEIRPGVEVVEPVFFKIHETMAVKNNLYGYFRATIDVPDTTKRLYFENWSISYKTSNNIPSSKVYKVIFAIDDGTPITITPLSVPQPGQILKGVVPLRWESSGGAGKATTSQGYPGQPTQYGILMKTGAEGTWKILMNHAEFPSFDLDTFLLPEDDDITLRITATDGIREAHHDIKGLSIENRPPRVIIKQPAPGLIAETTFPWSFFAFVYEPDGDALTTGVWTSSLDGILGKGKFISDILLNTGHHKITYSITDINGNPGSDTMELDVVSQLEPDYAVAQNALNIITKTGTQGATQQGNVFLENEPSIIQLGIDSPGTLTTATAWLYLEAPGSPETLLASLTDTLEPLSSLNISCHYTPSTPGCYKIRALVSDVEPQESNTLNNGQEWRILCYKTSGDLLEGDINTDGIIDAADVVCLVRFWNATQPLLGLAFENAKFEDGKIMGIDNIINQIIHPKN